MSWQCRVWYFDEISPLCAAILERQAHMDSCPSQPSASWYWLWTGLQDEAEGLGTPRVALGEAEREDTATHPISGIPLLGGRLRQSMRLARVPAKDASIVGCEDSCRNHQGPNASNIQQERRSEARLWLTLKKVPRKGPAASLQLDPRSTHSARPKSHPATTCFSAELGRVAVPYNTPLAPVRLSILSTPSFPPLQLSRLDTPLPHHGGHGRDPG
jgi:hypothetical protein